jgi:hypothetical protein
MADVIPIVRQGPTGISPGVAPIVTSEAPQSRLSGAEVAQPAEEMAKAFGQASDALSDAAVPLAERGADEDLLRQKVTRNADGSVNVENPITAPLIFGAAGNAYHHAAAAGTIAQWSNTLSEQFTDLHTQHPTDPAAFKNASDSFLAKINTGNPEIQQAVMREGAQLQTQHFNAITDKAADIDIDNQKKSILSLIDDQKNTAIALARQGGTGTPEFGQAVAKMNASYDALGTNPLFKTPQDQIDLEKKNTAGLLQGEALVSSVDSTFTKKGKAAAQDILEKDILQNPNLREVDRTRLYTQGMARLQFLTADAKASTDANRAITTEMEKGLADNKLKAEDPAVGMAIQRATAMGDAESAQRLTAAAAVQQHFRAVSPLPDSVRSEALGVHLSPVERVQGAILGQESGNRDNAPMSVTGAAGPGQVEPATFAQYARPGERIDNPADNRAVSGRIIADYYQKYGGDNARIAVAYFSGPGNVAPPGSPTPWITDKKDPTGKSVSSYVSDVAGRLGAPSANGGPPFTADDVQRNPFLLSAYVRSLAADPETRIQSAKQTAASVSKSIDNGSLPPPDAVGEVNQAAKLFPDKMGDIADEMNGKLAGQRVASVPAEQRQQYVDALKAATAGPDIHQINLAAAALGQVKRQEENMKEHPLVEASNRGWTPPPMEIDPSKPETIAPALAQRATLSARIGALNSTPSPPLLDKDDMPKLQTALQGQAGAQVLGTIGQTLKPDEMQTLLKEDAFRASVTGMSRSGDPAKMNAAYSFMDTQQKQNPLQFDKQFPDGLKDLRAWQSNLAFYPPDVAAKRLMQAYDPAQAAGRDAADKVADEALKTLSPDKVVAKFSTGWGPFGTGARAPVSEQAGTAAGALKADYDKNYRDGFTATGDPAAADKFAMEKLNLKYAVSPTNGNRITANAPERYYPQVGGSYDWMGKQLDEAVAKQLGLEPPPSPTDTSYIQPAGLGTTEESPGVRKYGAGRALVPDDATDRDITNGKPPSYQVIIRDPNGRWSTMTGPSGATQRFRFDPAQPFAERAAAAETARPTMQLLAEQSRFGSVTP